MKIDILSVLWTECKEEVAQACIVTWYVYGRVGMLMAGWIDLRQQ